MLNEHLTRQLDIIPIEALGAEITVIGAGAIGGWATLSLVKAGYENVTVIDFDRVDTVNLNSQFFRYSDVGKSKVRALSDLVRSFTNVSINAVEERYERGCFHGVVISAVDSMAVRRSIWKAHAGVGHSTKAIIDPRMGGEAALLYVMNPTDEKDIRTYEKTLYLDAEAAQERCTAKSTIYTANLLAGLVVKAVKDLTVGKSYTRIAQWDIAGNHLEAFPSTQAGSEAAQG